MSRKITILIIAATVCSVCMAQSAPSTAPRVVELTAGKDSRYRQAGKASPVIETTAGERLILRITAFRAKQVARDGSIHGLALLDKDDNAVPGWRFFLHPGVQDLEVTAPDKVGRYHAVCTIICSDAHEGMGFTLLVSASSQISKE